MALVECRECKGKVSTAAAACPACGAPVRRASSGVATAVKVLVVAVLGWMVFRCTLAVSESDTSGSAPESSTPASVEAPAAPDMTAAAREQTASEWLAFVTDESQPVRLRALRAEALVKQFGDTDAGRKPSGLVATLQEEVAAAGDWSYRESTDPLTQRKTFRATVRSKNTLNLDFPYEGEQRATLMVRNHPEFGRSVILSIEEGQILCRSYGDCPVRIVFDDSAPRTVDGDPPADHGSETVFLPWSLTSRISKAKEMRVQFNLYKHGAPTMVFDVRGLDLERLQ